ncbi:hypothetical protein BC628DRAFT_1326638 [Trametes gibbosa]|nr:hypothetical protein BC628DRAFT_1326638 [Trametes gibbosa]
MENVTVTLEDMKRAFDFIRFLKGATLDSMHSGLSEDTRHQLRYPPEELVEINKNDDLFSIELYLDLHNVSQECYNKVCATVNRRHPGHKLLSFYLVKTQVELLTGIVPIVHDMCVARNQTVGSISGSS